jgi:protein-disulfide isomerase
MSFKKIIVALVATGSLASCVSRADIEEIKANEKDILAKLDKMAAAPARPQQPQQQQRGPDPTATYAFPLGDAVLRGSSDALVTIVEVSDFQCPYCKRVGPTLEEVSKKYGKEVRFAFKHNPLSFHQRAKPAARAAECAKAQGKFWEMHDTLFQHQDQLADADFEKHAGTIGIDVGKWKTCYSANTPDPLIDADQATAVSFGARGTPAFFINGRFLSGAQPVDSFSAIIDEELKKVKASGLDGDKYYTQEVVGKGIKRL